MITRRLFLKSVGAGAACSFLPLGFLGKLFRREPVQPEVVYGSVSYQDTVPVDPASDLRKELKEGLADWWAKQLDEKVFQALCGKEIK